MSGALQRSVKMVVIGDGSVGKTCLLMSFKDNEIPDTGIKQRHCPLQLYECPLFSDDYVPTVFDNYTTSTVVDGETVRLANLSLR